MRRVLLDEGVPVGVRRLITGCSVETVAEAGWAGLTNGNLIAAAEQAGFEIMVTADKNIRYQQNLMGRRMALIVLETPHWATIQAKPSAVMEAVERAEAGTYTIVSYDRRPVRRRPYRPSLDN